MAEAGAGTNTTSGGASLWRRVSGSKELGILLVLIGMVVFIGVFNPSFPERIEVLGDLTEAGHAAIDAAATGYFSLSGGIAR